MLNKFIVCIISLAVILVNADVPECASSLRYWETYSTLTNCLQSNPVSQSKKASALKSLRLAIENYAFVDIAKSPPNTNLAPPVDLMANLALVEKASHSSDADLQQALADAFIPLHDAHTRYNKPKPYASSFYVQPFRFDSVLGSSNSLKLILRYSASDMDVYTSLYGTPAIPSELSSVDGWEIVSMNGKPAVQVFSEEFDVGTTKDAGSRFNLAVNGYGDTKGYYGWRALARYGIPKTESITYVLAAPEGSFRGKTVSVTVNWMGLYQDGHVGVRAAVEEALQMAAARTVKEQGREDEVALRLRIHEKYSAVVSESPSKAAPTAVQTAASSGAPVADASGVAYGDLSEEVGVLKVSTFGPPNMAVFRSRVVEAMKNFSTSSSVPVSRKKLILDLRSNGGGDICLGYALNRYLFPATTVHTNGHGPHSMARYDMKKSDLFAAMSAAGAQKLNSHPEDQTACAQDPEVVGYFTPCAWFSGAATSEEAVRSSNIINSDGHWMDGAAVKRTRGGLTSEYSSLIHEGCELEYAAWAPPGAGFGGISPDRVMLLSDGLCGSTCAVFSSSVQLTGLAKTVVIGGYPNKEQLFWSFPGGEVETIEFLVSSAEKLGLASDPHVPELLPDGATFRFAIREIYPWNTPYGLAAATDERFTPLEFVFAPAEHHIYYSTSATDNNAVMQQVVALFSDSCPAAGYRSPVSGSCSTCPPGSLADASGTGCVCGYGRWDATSGTCGFDSGLLGSAAHALESSAACGSGSGVSAGTAAAIAFSSLFVGAIVAGGLVTMLGPRPRKYSDDSLSSLLMKEGI